MKVKELVKRLQQFDQELEVVVQSRFCEFNEVVGADCVEVNFAINDHDNKMYYDLVPEVINTPGYPFIKVQEVLKIS